MKDVTLCTPPRIGMGRFSRALVLENPDPSLDDHLRAIGVEVTRLAEIPDEAELIRILERDPYDLIYKRSRVEISRKVVQAAPQLFAVMLCCIGDDSVDKQACAEHGVLVTNDPVSNGRSVTELVIGEIIAMSRRLFEAVDETNGSRFLKSQARRFEVRGKTLGVLGLGNIGKQVAQVAEHLGMRIIFHDNREVAREVGETMGWGFVPTRRELFSSADYVTAHISAADYKGRPNENIITYDDFAAMSERGEGSPRMFLNLARGAIHAADDLLRAVNDGHISYAFVDVFPSEPGSKSERWENPYASEPRIYATPHIGASTLEAQPRIAKHVAHTTQRLSYFGTLRNCVYAPKHVIGFDSLEGVEHVLTVVHSNDRGTKKAIDDMIYNAGASNLVSEHRDFNEYGIAYHAIAMDQPLEATQLEELARSAVELTKSPRAVRSIRQITVSGGVDA